MKSLKKIIYSFGYLGFVPKCPGTFGTLGGVVIWFFVAGNIFLAWHCVLDRFVFWIMECE